ncbi:DUF4129 domain-containing protein [Paenibacillus nasutitermitis]|uniref:DUF4129 domain-containing protein n=1 Tax=Paenibacillus nasutitermitis TaxID=1652958 RepID=A0A916YWP9_9BACL|nr:DUF4129 domain-containing protein [Paenibacillus nasutitermitis]GGD63386.1 hypothetical protein GCM10010911_21450 [Paenibacillus nasutitermitis]
MTVYIRASSKALLQGLIELLLFMPVAFLIQAFLFEGEASWMWLILIPLGYPLGLMIIKLLKFKHPVMITLIGFAAGIGLSALLLGVTKAGAVSALTLSLGMTRGGLMAVSMQYFRLHARHYVIGIAVYFIVSLIFGRMPAFEPYQSALIGFGLVALLLTLFSANSGYVNDESLSGNGRPAVEPTVRKQNRLLVSIMAVITVAIVFTYQIQAALGALWNTFKEWLKQLFSRGDTQNVPQQEMEPPAVPPQLPDGDGKSMPPWVDYILYGVAALVGLVLLYLVLRQLRHVPAWLKRLQEKLMKLFGREQTLAAQGYVDEVSSLPKTGRLGGLFRSRTKEPRVRYKDLQDNESRLRYLYRQRLGRQVKAGYDFKPFLTPLETDTELQGRGEERSAADLAQPYSNVRYGNKKISDQELERIAEAVNKSGR